jgi:hypothetical protein
MKNIIEFFKYYTYGFLLSFVMVNIIHLYGLLVDSFYEYTDFIISAKVVLLIAIPNGLNLWIIKLLDKPEVIKNKYYKLYFKLFSSYWFGIIFSFVLLSSLLLLKSLVSINFFNFISEDNLLQLTFLLAIPLALFANFLINKK